MTIAMLRGARLKIKKPSVSRCHGMYGRSMTHMAGALGSVLPCRAWPAGVRRALPPRSTQTTTSPSATAPCITPTGGVATHMGVTFSARARSWWRPARLSPAKPCERSSSSLLPPSSFRNEEPREPVGRSVDRPAGAPE